MRIRTAILFCFLTLPVWANYREFLDVPVDPSITTKLRHAAETSLAAFPNMKADDLALTLIDVANPSTVGRGDYHGDTHFYPASVIKLFYMEDVFATHKENVPDVGRALKEMIGVSDNDATAYIVDVLADTTPGPDLNDRQLRKFVAKRRAITQRFQKLGYTDNVNAMMKPWSFGPFGRDRQALGPNRENRNMATSNSVASLMLWILRRRAPSSEAMMSLLARPIDVPLKTDDQVKEFIGEALPAGTKLWSKAGWTSEVRHDAAYIELPNGKKMILVIFTRGQAADTTLIPAIAKNVLAEF